MALSVQPDPLTAGQSATITVSGSSHAGEIITVKIHNEEDEKSQCEITLNADGDGTATWTPPDSWTEAFFNYSSCTEVFRVIQSGAEETASTSTGTSTSTTPPTQHT